MMGSVKRNRMATANFINEGNCLVTKDWAKRVESYKKNYFAETPVFAGQKTYDIYSTFFNDADDDVAAFWGVIKVSYKI